MTRVILIHGVPSSGKTTLAEKIIKRLPSNIVSEASVRNITGISGKTANDYKKISEITNSISQCYITDSDDYLVIDEVGLTDKIRSNYEAIGEIFMNTITGDSSDASVQSLYESPNIRDGQDLKIDNFNYDSDSIINFIKNLK
tara:strand:- start:1019 stop:1447 length:429 start_codon:yes stop_codon:yes gene_type:complete